MSANRSAVETRTFTPALIWVPLKILSRNRSDGRHWIVKYSEAREAKEAWAVAIRGRESRLSSFGAGLPTPTTSAKSRP